MFYSLIKKLLFSLDPERAHHFSLKSLHLIKRLGMMRCFSKTASAPRTLMGLTFPNAIGLGAGLDKNGDYLEALSALHFGFIEIGTVTPKPQVGNPLPRIFRLPKEAALINRLGFNNKGVAYVAERLEKLNYPGILGINIGKNRDTPLNNAVDDYLFCFRSLAKFASYMTINISSPNTPGLRDLQQGDLLSHLLATLKQEQKIIEKNTRKYIPLVVKISPDLTEPELRELAKVLIDQQIDGVIATNTTTHREGVEHTRFAKENGGLSGKPLITRSTSIIRLLHDSLQGRLPIIASGGIMDEQSAEEKLAAGATLLQLHTGFIYEGPGLVKRLIKATATYP